MVFSFISHDWKWLISSDYNLKKINSLQPKKLLVFLSEEYPFFVLCVTWSVKKKTHIPDYTHSCIICFQFKCLCLTVSLSVWACGFVTLTATLGTASLVVLQQVQRPAPLGDRSPLPALPQPSCLLFGVHPELLGVAPIHLETATGENIRSGCMKKKPSQWNRGGCVILRELISCFLTCEK